MRPTFCALLLFALGACTRRETPTQDAAPPPPAAPWAGISLARSTATTPPRSEATIVLLDASGVRLAGDAEPLARLPGRDAWAHGFEASAKRKGPADLYLVPLHDRIERVPDGGARRTALLAIAADVPFRPVVEVLFTLGQAEVPEVGLVVASAAGATEIPVVFPHVRTAALGATASAMQRQLLEALQGDAGKIPPAPPPPKLADARDLALTVILGATGIAVKAGGANVAPGCKEHGAGVAVPSHDFAALTACASSLRAVVAAARDEHGYTLTADPDEPFASVVGAFDALRAASFDRPQIGVPR